MVLHIRKGPLLYEIDAPPGSRVEPTSAGSTALLIPGPRAEDTCMWLPAATILDAARKHRYGLNLRNQRPVAG